MTHLSAFKRSALCLTLILSCGILHAQQTGPTPYPNPKDESAWKGVGPIRVFPWMTDNRNWFWSKRAQADGSIFLIGDSLLGNWGNEEQLVKAGAFPGRKVANRAIGGDVSRGVLWRVQEDVLDLHPKAMVLMIGSNDLSAHAKIDGILANISAIIHLAQEKVPGMPIILCTLTPRKSKEAPIDNQWLLDLNNQLRDLATKEKNVTLFDAFPLFADANNEPIPQYYKPDLLHLDKPGYAKLEEGLTKIFVSLNL